MAVTEAFTEALSSGKIRLIRIMMKDSLLNDPTFSEFMAMEDATHNLAGLYDEHDGREFIEDKGIWDDNYMNELMVQIVGNFSHERIKHLKDVVTYLYSFPIPEKRLREYTKDREKANNSTDNHDGVFINSQQAQRRTDSGRGAKIAGGAIVGAIAGTAIAEKGSSSLMFACGFIGALAGAIIATIVTKEA